MSNAIGSYGVTLTRNGNTIAELTSIGSPALKLDTKEVTNHQSANSYREYIGTLLDGGEVSISGNFIASDTNGQIGLIDDMNNKTLQSFVITFPAAITATWTFSALVTAFEMGEMTPDGSIEFSATLKISGKPTLAITASNNITALTISSTTLYPAFAATTYDYVGDATTADVTFTATFAAGVCKLYKEGVEVQSLTSGVASSAQSLGAVGSMVTFQLKITETGKVARTYTIKIAREV